jgi:release factor glutamine methyltransferase
MPNIAEILRESAEMLGENAVAEPRREAASLLAFALGRDKTFLVAHSEYELSGDEENIFRGFVLRRAAREPFQYITGRQEFYGLEFIVTPDVLIPRPETEIIVENALEFLRLAVNPIFCEVGVGSGCISVSILHELKTARAVGLDISEKALAIAGKNAEKHGVAEMLELRISDVFNQLSDEKFDLIISNPPYISAEEVTALQKEVRDFEPLTALTDGGNGFSIIEKIVANAPRHLKTDGFLLAEIGFGQAKKVTEMFDANIWQSVEILPDLQGIPRTVRARIKR